SGAEQAPRRNGLPLSAAAGAPRRARRRGRAASGVASTRFGVTLCLLDPVRHEALEHIQRHGAVGQDHVVEGADVKTLAQALLRSRPQFLDLEFADLVRQRLTGPAGIAVDLRFNAVPREG